MNRAEILESRVKSVLSGDYSKKSSMITDVIKSDVFNVLSNYFELDSDKLVINIEQSGEIYVIKMLAHAKNIKSVNYLRN